jgi:RNA polymerase sigma factor (sigma-70 family)
MGSDELRSQTTIDSDTLVARLRSQDDEDAWRQVDRRYGPLLVAFGARMGLDPEQGRDARQDAMMAFVETIRGGRFDRTRGRLRDLLFAIARNKIIAIHNRRVRDTARVGGGSSAADLLATVPGEDAWKLAWESEWRVAIAGRCLEEAQQKFRPETYLSFYLKAIEGLPSAVVAKRLGKTANAVDIATNRVRGFLRRIKPVIEELF